MLECKIKLNLNNYVPTSRSLNVTYDNKLDLLQLFKLQLQHI